MTACSETMVDFTPLELVTVTPSGRPMAMPSSMPAEPKWIQRSARPTRRKTSP